MMPALLRWLFGGRKKEAASDASIWVTGWWLGTEVRLPAPIKTPLGGRITLVHVCVDIRYRIVDGRIALNDARLARSSQLNIAGARRGEAWRADSSVDRDALFAAILADVEPRDSQLARIMFGKWRASRGDQASPR